MIAWAAAILPMATRGLLPMLSRTDQVSSTECDRCPYVDHGVLVILRQECARKLASRKSPKHPMCRKAWRDHSKIQRRGARASKTQLNARNVVGRRQIATCGERSYRPRTHTPSMPLPLRHLLLTPQSMSKEHVLPTLLSRSSGSYTGTWSFELTGNNPPAQTPYSAPLLLRHLLPGWQSVSMNRRKKLWSKGQAPSRKQIVSCHLPSLAPLDTQPVRQHIVKCHSRPC